MRVNLRFEPRLIDSDTTERHNSAQRIVAIVITEQSTHHELIHVQGTSINDPL